MKAKLIKNYYGYEYFLADETGSAIATSDNGKLSKQNCDEIFGVVDINSEVEAIVKTICPDDRGKDVIYGTGMAVGIQCFNKAMELNKMFTLEDVKKSIEMAREENGLSDNTMSYDYSEDEIIQSLQQPTEIEVEIIMKNSRTGNIVKHDSDLEWDEDGLCDRAIPKLDSSGCLILTKKI
jgi:hypothetical protein